MNSTQSKEVVVTSSGDKFSALVKFTLVDDEGNPYVVTINAGLHNTENAAYKAANRIKFPR